MRSYTNMSISDSIFKSYQKTKSGRIVLGELFKDEHLPNLNSIQIDSYNEFLQEESYLNGRKREKVGLEFLLSSVFPFTSSDGKLTLEYGSYQIESPKETIEEAVERNTTYSVAIKANISLVIHETGEIKEQEIYICDVPYMTPNGTFIINGAERVVVSQIHRSPGVIFEFNNRTNLFHSRLIPEKGPWLDFEIVKDTLCLRIDRKARIPISTFFRALGWTSNESILELFYETEKIHLTQEMEDSDYNLPSYYSCATISVATKTESLKKENLDDKEVKDDGKTDQKKSIRKKRPIILAGEKITSDHIKKLRKIDIKTLAIISEDQFIKKPFIINTIQRDSVLSQEQACVYLSTVYRGTEPANYKIAKDEIIRRWKNNVNDEIIDSYDKPVIEGVSPSDIVQVDKSIFFNKNYYSLGEVGRYKIIKKFDYKNPTKSLSLEIKDILSIINYLIGVRNGEIFVDDIDHLGSRRVRCVGEQLTNHLKISFARMERLARERMIVQEYNTLTPQNLLSIKPIVAGVKEFFGTGQLSQFMDQTNPLSAVTHKRRLNALGPGGLTRERAGFEVRDIHYTHYGRICPIETPEGPNIGLIVSLASHAKINKYGFIESPYYKIKDGKVTDNIEYLSAIEEDRFKVTHYNNHLNLDKSFKDKLLPIREKGNYPMIYPKEIQYMDVSPMQIISISSSLIPFLEHDDANRALMGSNMQRQAVPLLFPDSPIVGTGVERVTAKYSGFCVYAQNPGKVSLVDNAKIVIENKDKKDIYELKKSSRTNQNTFYNQRPVVKEGQDISKGQLLADGPAVQNGEIALGKNVLTAFMTWEGYNYEDAILMSEKLFKDDTFVSVHIEEFEIEARETRLGKETITQDIPSISEEEYKKLDEDGIVCIGSRVKSGNVLVGKLTPRGDKEMSPEYKLLHSIFGEKAKNVKDTSLRVPHSTEGVVVDVRKYSRENKDVMKPGVIEHVKVYLAKKRKLREGDKFAGRHGNKGIVARVMPEMNMPYMKDGTPIDLVLNPLGVPSRMNIGQVFELILGFVGYKNNVKLAVPSFSGIGYNEIEALLKKSNISNNSIVNLYDGRTGEPFKNPVTVGYMYYLKLAHLAEDKIHARSTGPYSLVTQQPLGGKAQFGGQRIGEMEVWAIEAYGAANILQEFLTVKSDAMDGRSKMYELIVKGEYVSAPGIPESFNVLIQELRGLCLNVEIYDKEGNEILMNKRRKNKNTKSLI